jgi:hypothetical protein
VLVVVVADDDFRGDQRDQGVKVAVRTLAQHSVMPPEHSDTGPGLWRPSGERPRQIGR